MPSSGTRSIFAASQPHRAALERPQHGRVEPVEAHAVLRLLGPDHIGARQAEAGRLRNLIASEVIGSRHKIEIIRDGKREQAELVIQEAPKERARKPAMEPRPIPVNPLGGVLVDELTPSVAKQLGLDSDNGVVIAGVEEGSLAEAAGLVSGMRQAHPVGQS